MQSSTKPKVSIADPTTPSQQLAIDSSGRATVNTNRAGAPNMANGQVTASGTAGTLVASRATRRYVTVKNLDTSLTVYIGIATVTAGNGMPLKGGESVSLDFTGLIQVIAASGSPIVAYAEVYD